MNRAVPTKKSYLIGYISSIVLTIAAFVATANNAGKEAAIINKNNLIICISLLAITQLFVHLIFFLHLGKESRPKWNLMAFLLAGFIIVVLVGGTLWIMQNLEYSHVPSKSPEQMENYMLNDEAVKPFQH